MRQHGSVDAAEQKPVRWWQYALVADANVLPAVLGLVEGWSALDLFALYWLNTTLAGFWACARGGSYLLGTEAGKDRWFLLKAGAIGLGVYLLVMAFVGIQVHQLDPVSRESLGWGQFDHLVYLLRHIGAQWSVLVSIGVMFGVNLVQFLSGRRRQSLGWDPGTVLSRLVARFVLIAMLIYFAAFVAMKTEDLSIVLVAVVLVVTAAELVVLRHPDFNPLEWLREHL